MKKLKTFTLLLATIFLTASIANAQSIQGKGKVVTETWDIENFEGLGLGISAEVTVKQGNTQKVVVRGQKNIIDLIKKDVKGGSWDIGFEKGKRVRNYEKLEIEVTVKKLKAVAIGGSGSIKGTNTFDKSGKFAVAIGGSGNVDMDVEADDVTVSIGGSGVVELSGKTNDFMANLSGSGKINTSELNADSAQVNSSGSGHIHVHASNKLTAMVSGSGIVEYSGSPTVKSTVSGSGKVKAH